MSFWARVKEQWSVDTVWMAPRRIPFHRYSCSALSRRGGAQTYRAAEE